MNHVSRLPLLVILFALGTFFCFSTYDALCRWVILHGLPQTQSLAIAHVFALIPVLLFVHHNKQWSELRPKEPHWVLARALVAVFEVGCVFYTLTHLKMAESYTLFLTMPLWAALLGALLLGEKLRHIQILGVIVGFCGVLLAMRPSIEGFSFAQLTGLGVGFFASLSVIIMRKIGRKESAGTILLTLFVVLSIMNALMVYSWRPMALDGEFAILALAGLIMGIGHVSFYSAIRYAPAPMFAPFQYTQIFWMLLYGAVLFGEPVVTHVIAGLALVSLGGTLIIGRLPAKKSAILQKEEAAPPKEDDLNS